MATEQREPRADQYDVIVVGAGFGGLSAAAFLAKSGRHVLLLERQDGPGGVGHAFTRGPYTFDPAIHITSQARPGLPFDLIMKILGVDKQVEFLPIESMYGVAYPDLKEHLPVGREPFFEAHARHFPGAQAELREFIRICAQVTRESQELPPQVAFRDLDKALARYPTLFKYRNLTVSQALDEFITDPKLKSLVASSWPYLGLPPDELSFFSWSGMTMAVLDDGPAYSKGSFQRVADAFVTALERNGGEFVPRTVVDKILVEDNQATGVRLDSGRVIRAPIVIANADARHTFEELVGPDHLPASFMRNFRRLTPSHSAVVIYAATSLDLRQYDAAHETFIYRHWDHNQTQRDILAGQPGGMWVNVPTIADPSLAPEGEHVVIMTSLAPFDIGKPWGDERSRYTESMVDEIEGLFPGFRDKITHIETATPATLHRYARNSEGAIYGWANTAAQAGTKRPSRQTPIRGLYLSGHWSQPGSGSFRAVYSGLLVSSEIQGHENLGTYFDGMLRDAGLAGPPVPPSRSMGVVASIAGIWGTQLIYVAAKLGIPDLITAHGPLSAERIAELTDSHPRSIYRVMRALTTLGLFDENERHDFRLTPLGFYLRSDVEGSVRQLAVMFGEPWHWQSWGNLLHSVKTGQPAFEYTFGMGTYQYVTEHPEAAEVYDQAMTGITLQAAPGIARHYDFSKVRTLMDVGGGHGTLLNVIMQAHPHLKGMLFDLPHVVAGAHAPLAAAGLTERCAVLSGNVFEGVPKGADTIMAKSFIHSFDDETSVKLLTNFREALPPEGGRVLVVEMSLPGDNTPHFGKLFDIEMLTQSDDGRDRTESEYRELFARAGLRLTRVVDTGSPVNVIEGVPIGES
ncbi:MAG: FAD-dependent oxidoreductase [Thermomicrobiales bacterium]